MQINLIPDSSVGSAPAGFTAAIQAAADVFEQDLPGNYTVNLTYGWGTYDDAVDDSLANPNSGDFSLGGNATENLFTYQQVKSWLGADAAIASLPATPTYAAYDGDDEYLSGANVVELSSAQQKALGEYTGTAGAVDGSIGFNVGDGSDSSYWETAAFVEIGHALGWFSGYESASTPTLLDLFRYGSAGVPQPDGSKPSYLSFDGGATVAADFSDTFDYTLFKNVPANEPFNLDADRVPTTSLTSLDLEVFNLLGFGLPDVVTETAPASLSPSAGFSSAIGGVQLIDAGAGDDTFTTVVSAGAGLLTASGAGVSGSGGHGLTITGGFAAVNAALGTLGYSDPSAGADAITITTTDLANQSSASQSIAVAVAPTTVADFDANRATLDASPGGFTITDSAADVSAALDALNADSHLNSITLTDSGTPTLTLTVAQALDDTAAIGKIANAAFAIDVVDRQADLAALSAADIAALAAEKAIALVSSDASIQYDAAQTAAIQTGGLAVKAPANDEARENFANGTGEIWVFGPTDALVKRIRDHADGSIADFFYGPPGTFLGVAYATFEIDFSAAGARTGKVYSDASGAAVASQTFTAYGGYFDYVGGAPARERTVQASGAFDVHHFGAAGTVGGASYSSFDVAFTPAGARSSVTYYDSSDDVVAMASFASNGGFTLDVGGALYESKIVNADGSFELEFGDIAGQSYTSYQTDFAGGAVAAHSIDYGAGAGTLDLFGSGLQIAQGSGLIGPGTATHDFVFTVHADETYDFEPGAADDTLTFAAGFGAATINGLAAAGASNDIVNLSGLFAGYSDAQAAMTVSGDDTIIADGHGDTLTLLGAAPSALSAARLGFG